MGGATTRRGTGRQRRKQAAAGGRPEITTLVLQPGAVRVHIVQVRRPAACEELGGDGGLN